jgi:lipid-A-disaccharide synthase-like uncharacterized protein
MPIGDFKISVPVGIAGGNLKVPSNELHLLNTTKASLSMLKRVLSSGVSMILVTSVLYLFTIIAVMGFAIDDYDSRSTDEVESVFWTLGILGTGIILLVFVQFVLNMYVLKPLSDFRAASLILANAFIAGAILKYFLSISIGS